MVPAQADALRSEYGIVLCVLGIANSRSMLLQKLLPVDASTWQDELSLRVRRPGCWSPVCIQPYLEQVMGACLSCDPS